MDIKPGDYPDVRSGSEDKNFMIPFVDTGIRNETHMRPIVTCPPYENRGCGFHAKMPEAFSYKKIARNYAV
jgi:hypothetical protein